MVGCGSAAGPDRLSSPPADSSEREADRPAGSDREVAALLGGRPVRWSALRDAMTEAAGGQVLGEWVLNRRVEAALEEEGLTVTEEDEAREKSMMLRQLADDPDQAVRLLEQLRERRGLGPERFAMLLRRNAGLRKLVAEEVEVTDAMVRREYDRRHGEKTVARLILVPTLQEASAVLDRLDEGESFIDLAVEVSRDSSRDQGGLLPPIAPGDATFPSAVRNTVARLEPGETADPVSLERGFAILRAEHKIEPRDVAFDRVSDDLREAVRRQVEQTLMRRRARVLMQEAEVTILDAQLDRAWKQQRGDLLEAQ